MHKFPKMTAFHTFALERLDPLPVNTTSAARDCVKMARFLTGERAATII